MSRMLIVGVASACALASDSSAGWRWFGATVGETSGFTYRQLAESGADEVGIGWSTIGEDAVQLHFASEFQFYSHDKPDARSLQLYAGWGARVKFERNTRYGLRLPIGV